MSKMITDSKNYEDIADAIRAKNASSDTYEPGDMAQAIDDIPTGGTDNPCIEITERNTDGKITKVKLHNYNATTGKTDIDPGTFYEQYNLTEIAGTENITEIGMRAFGFEKDSHVAARTYILNLPNCEVFGDYAFIGRYTLSSGSPGQIRINPRKMTKIGVRAFSFYNNNVASCPEIVNLESLEPPFNSDFYFDNLSTLGSYAFYYCKNVFWGANLIMPKIQAIPEYCFSFAPGLIGLLLDNCVTVSNYAFSHVNTLEIFEAPNLKNIGQQAFASTGIQKIWIKEGGNVYGTSVYNVPFLNCETTLEIFTDAESKPSLWGSYFDVVSNTYARATVHYGATYQDFLDA